MEVEKYRTPISINDAIEILKRSFDKYVQGDFYSALPYLLAIFSIENARGNSVWNYNWGNVITYSPEQQYYKHDGNNRHFRSLQGHQEGSDYFIKTLLTPTNIRIMSAALADDFDGFFSGIHDINPETKKAYNYLEDGPFKNKAKESFRSLVNEFKKTFNFAPNVQKKKTIEK